MATSRRMYQAVARSISRELTSPEHNNGQKHAIAAVARRIASDFSDDNPRFRHDKFYAACGLNDQGYPDNVVWFGKLLENH